MTRILGRSSGGAARVCAAAGDRPVSRNTHARKNGSAIRRTLGRLNSSLRSRSYRGAGAASYASMAARGDLGRQPALGVRRAGGGDADRPRSAVVVPRRPDPGGRGEDRGVGAGVELRGGGVVLRERRQPHPPHAGGEAVPHALRAATVEHPPARAAAGRGPDPGGLAGRRGVVFPGDRSAGGGAGGRGALSGVLLGHLARLRAAERAAPGAGVAAAAAGRLPGAAADAGRRRRRRARPPHRADRAAGAPRPLRRRGAAGRVGRALLRGSVGSVARPDRPRRPAAAGAAGNRRPGAAPVSAGVPGDRVGADRRQPVHRGAAGRPALGASRGPVGGDRRALVVGPSRAGAGGVRRARRRRAARRGPPGSGRVRAAGGAHDHRGRGRFGGAAAGAAGAQLPAAHAVLSDAPGRRHSRRAADRAAAAAAGAARGAGRGPGLRLGRGAAGRGGRALDLVGRLAGDRTRRPAGALRRRRARHTGAGGGGGRARHGAVGGAGVALPLLRRAARSAGPLRGRPVRRPPRRRGGGQGRGRQRLRADPGRR